ncbi:cysteine dioxygenase family protein [Synechococcus sp. WH 8020]|uniref:cysteine dioxygenase family protein n=1 Tax=Synechococcus sp. (strain WH8020) TaxID=32052 RepID=UPI00069F4FD0|nr:cysteine dioxygenase family protein [Synechococcus sp. WH 8020]
MALSTTEPFPPSLKVLIKQLNTLREPSSAELIQCIASCHIQASDLIPWATPQHPPTESYGRQLVWHGSHVEVMVMTWLPGDHSAIHDHGSALWGAVQCFGEAQHQSFGLQGNVISHKANQPFAPQQIRLIEPGLIHQMGNTGQSTFLSLHIYGTSSRCSKITGSARIFNVAEGCIQTTDGGVFFDLPEDQVLSCRTGLTADRQLKQEQNDLLQQRRAKAERA